MVLHALRRDLLLDHVKMTDDLTLVMLVCPDRARTLARIEVPVALESLAAVRAFVEAQSPDLPEVTASLFLVAVVEVVTNVIRHATGLVPDAPIELVAERTPGGLELNVIYLGDHFEPPADPPEASLDEFPEGGFGLHIIFSACDQVDYLHEQGLNTVRLRVRNPDRA
jgi:anti-sigma regulatory factor (Ser/Thr protein kinase)